MSEIAEIWTVFFGLFCIFALPAVVVMYFVNLWLNRRNPAREQEMLNRPLSTFDRVIKITAGGLLIILGLLLLAWPFFAINVLKEPGYLNLDVSENLLSNILKITSYFSMVILFLSLGYFYIKTGIKGRNEKATSDSIRF